MKKIIVILIFSGISNILNADDTIKFTDKIRLKVSCFNEGVMIPLYPAFTSKIIHPGGQFGFEYYYNEKAKSQFFQTVNFGFFIHEKYEHGLYINSEAGYRYILPFGLSFDGLFGLGYLHTISDRKEFKQDNTGLYKEIQYAHRLAEGGMVSSLFDLMKFTEALFDGNLLKDSTFTEMRNWRVFPDNQKLSYGLGIVKWNSFYGECWGHDGSSIGYRARMYFFPDNETIVLVFTNGCEGKPEKAFRDFVDIYERSELFDIIFDR